MTELNIFLLKLTNACKRVFGIFFISLRSSVICNDEKRPGFYTLAFTFLSMTQDLNKIKKKKNPEHPFVKIVAK